MLRRLPIIFIAASSAATLPAVAEDGTSDDKGNAGDTMSASTPEKVSPEFRRAETLDVIETTKGETLQGIISEKRDGDSLKIQLVTGGSRIVARSEIAKLLIRPNPDYDPNFSIAAPAPKTVTSDKPSDAETVDWFTATATSGGRFSLQPTSLFASGEFGNSTNPSLGGSLGLGYELIVAERVGITAAMRASYTYWRYSDAQIGSPTAMSVSVMGDVKFAYHFGRLIPFAGFALGTDMHFFESKTITGENEMNNGFAWNLAFGATYLSTDSLAFGARLDIHPESVAIVDANGFVGPKVGWVGLSLDMTVHF